MSLINDALKKAQKQRTGEAPSLGSMPSVGGQSASSISRSGKSGGNPLLVPAGIGAAVLVLAIGGYFAFSGKSEDRNQKTANSPTQVAAATPSSVASNPPSGIRSPFPEPAASAPTFTLPVAPKPEPVVAKVETPAPSAVKPAAPVTTSPAADPAKPAPKLEPRAMTFIDNIKIAGVRASATDSKVLMMDRVYRIGDVVDHEMGLKLVGITNNSLTFEDEKGGRYTRNL